MILALPETSAATILLRRAQQLRKVTGNESLRSQSEINQAQLSFKTVAFNALIKPWEINILDPAVLYTTFYTGLAYGIFYSFFEVFPLVYGDVYGFTLTELSLTFLAFSVAQLATSIVYMAYFKFIFERRVKKQGLGAIEEYLFLGLAIGWILPAGLFIFGKLKSFHMLLDVSARKY